MSEPRYSRAYYAAVCAFGRKYGTPLPKRGLMIGDDVTGFFLMLNPTAKAMGHVPPFGVYVQWNGWPAGIIEAEGGVMVAGAGANEDSLIEWLEAQTKETL